MAQDVRPPDLVVEQVEPVTRLGLRLAIQLSLQSPDRFRCCQAHRQSPHLICFENTPEVRVLPSTSSYPASAGTMTLSDFHTDRRLTASLRSLPSSHVDLPRLRVPLSRRAVPTTPVDRSRCICRLLPQTVLPSPRFGRVGVHNFPFEACSGFTHVTARRFARPPKAAFVAGLRYGQLPIRTACQLPGQPTITRVGLSPTR